jgi:hypothetical protein
VCALESSRYPYQEQSEQSMMGDFLADRSTNGSRPSSTNGSRHGSTNGSRFGGTSAYVAPAEIFPPLSSGAAIKFYYHMFFMHRRRILCNLYFPLYF